MSERERAILMKFDLGLIRISIDLNLFASASPAVTAQAFSHAHYHAPFFYLRATKVGLKVLQFYAREK